MMWVLTSLALLAVGAASSLLLTRVPKLALRLAMLLVLAASVLMVTAAGDVLLGQPIEGVYETAWPLSLGASRLSLDGLSAWFLMTIGLLAASTSIYTVPYLSSVIGREPVPAFCALFCGLLASLVLLVCAADAVLFLVGWEAMTLSAFLLVSFRHDQPEVRRGAWMYLVATHIGTALFVLPLFGVLVARCGDTAFSSFAAAAVDADHMTLAVLFFLGLVGFGTKTGVMPMHVWLPAAHPVAPTPVSALLSGVVVKTGVYGLLRLLTWLPPLPRVCGEVLLIVGVASGVLGVLYALVQHDLKRLLAYHTVENIGIIMLGVAVGLLGEAADEPALAALGYTGALLHVTNHALFKGLLFLSAGSVIHHCGSGEIERLGGLARGTPFNATMFLVGAVAICGLPPLNGFVSEWAVYGALFGGAASGVGASGGLPALGLAGLALMGGLALACFAKVFGVVFLGEPREAGWPAQGTPAGMRVGMGLLGLLCVFIGILPGLWLPLVIPASAVVAGLPSAGAAARVEGVLAYAGRLSGLAAVLLAVVAGLVVLRRWAFLRAAARDGTRVTAVATWGCAFARPAARMQYTASSFASPLVAIFRVCIWPVRSLLAPAGPFPGPAALHTDAPDIAEHDFFAPVFRGAARLFTRVRTVSWRTGPPSPAASLVTNATERRHGPVGTLVAGLVLALRRGSIQVRLLFIALTLLALFLFEAFTSAVRPASTADEGFPRVLSREGVDR